MLLRKLDDGFFVSGQITSDDVDRLRSRGFSAIICNRPDGEDASQPAADEIARAAKVVGLEFHHLPVRSGADVPAQAARMAKTLGVIKGPVLAYCRSGGRSEALWRAARSLRSRRR
jgi:sulfide:quinone oxidoreductase